MSIEAQDDRHSGGGDESVLRLRLAILRRNLEQVHDTVGSVAQRRKEIHNLEEVFEEWEGIQTKAGWVADNVDQGMKLVDQLKRATGVPQATAERLRNRLSECARYAVEVKNQAEASANIIKAMARRWSSLSADEVFDSHIREIFAVKANDLMRVIDGLVTDPADAAWATYQKKIRIAAGDLFSEYVEFLSGLALRDSGLAEPVTAGGEAAAGEEHDPGAEDRLGCDVYMMADDLVKQIYRIGDAELWHSLTIPARRDAAARTVARMIRLGFPEWTIWAVPLSAHEFGRVVIDKKWDEISEWFTSRGETLGPGFEIVLADCFATYALGPAYAFASVYVLLDPSTARRRSREEEQLAVGSLRTDSDLVFVVFRMLEFMNEGQALTPVISELRQRLMAAVEQARGAEPPTGEAAQSLERQTTHIWDLLREAAGSLRADSDRAFVVFRMLELMNEGQALTPVISELRQRWMAAVEQARGAEPPTGEAAQSLERQTTRIWDFLREKAPGIQYRARRWDKATKWEPLANLVGGSWRLSHGKEDVRDILNAAWFQRLQAWTAPDPPLDQHLADAALTLWRRDLASRRTHRGMF